MSGVNCGDHELCIHLPSRTVQRVEVLRVQDICELRVAVPRHSRFGFQVRVAEANAFLDGEPFVPVRSDIHDTDLAE